MAHERPYGFRLPRGGDPRPYQICVLSTLLLYGALALDFEVTLGRTAGVVGTALLVQLVCSRLWRLPRFDPRSALTTGLSLSLLMRSDQTGLLLLGACVAVASKFLIRRDGKHVFNPSCLALVVMMAATSESGAVWVSAGQWGSAALFGFAVAGLGMLVLYRSARSDITWAFLFVYAAGRVARSMWLGEPLAIPLHGLQNGAFLVFAFFMISDPKTLPDSRAGAWSFARWLSPAARSLRPPVRRSTAPNGLLWSLVRVGSRWCRSSIACFPGPDTQWTRTRP